MLAINHIKNKNEGHNNVGVDRIIFLSPSLLSPSLSLSIRSPLPPPLSFFLISAGTHLLLTGPIRFWSSKGKTQMGLLHAATAELSLG